MKLFKRTKIVATIGPATSDYESILNLSSEGVDVCRINFSHGNNTIRQQIINSVHKINKEHHRHIALLGDLQGPKIRVGHIENDRIELIEGQKIILTTNDLIGNNNKISIDYEKLPCEIKPNDRILIDDGKLILQTISTNGKDTIIAKIIHGGTLSSRKGINLPDTKVSQSSLSDKDRKDLAFILQNRFQWVALSFVRSAEDIIELREEMSHHNIKKNPLIIAKIEKPEAIKDLDRIIQVSDAIMVARGDLGIEIPMEDVPLIQKMIIKKCLKASKPIIVATQMMESMINNFTPTRAEVNDVANSIMDGADAVMLSAETSVGKYPIQVIKNVSKIISSVESYEGVFNRFHLPCKSDAPRFITDSVCNNACILAEQVKAKAIVCMTHSGYTAIKLSSHRPKSPIFAFTNNHNILSKLSLVWGVKGFYYNNFESSDKTITDVMSVLKKVHYIHKNDIIINLISMPIDDKGDINTIKLSRV